MKKLEEIMIVNKNSGEIISENGTEIIGFIKNEETEHLKSLCSRAKNNPEGMDLAELDEYFKLYKRSPNRINGFDRYYQVNQHYDRALFELGVSKEAMYYFNFLVAYLCNLTYTLEFENHKNISTDTQVCEFLNINPKTWRKVRDELYSLNLMKQITFEGIKVYKINPCYIGKEKMLTPSTYHAFREDLIKHNMISKIQRVYWDKYMQSEYGIDYNLIQIEEV